ncbi:Tox-REase-5 domain-containing protein [Dactylosporangium salmoneum]|uniref:Tox-REase-5 domain-containing protein n=1 Tax=Dactylosporangium salmoneum TaxID=53361 RepID=A0ABP5UC03_9ACTN
MVLALAAGVGVVVWLGRADRTPFDEAVTDLAASPVLHYRADLGGTQLDVRVTGGGDMIGTLTLLGVKLDVLTMAGRTYVKAPGLLPGAGTAARWTTGGPLSAGATSWQQLGPLTMAGRLYIGLTEATFPSRLDRGEQIDGQAVLKASLPDGDLYVTKAAPHRIVRFAAKGGPSTRPSGLPSLPKIPSLPARPSRRALPSLLRDVLLAELTAPLRAPGDPTGGDLSFDMQPVSPADYDKTFTDLRTDAGELGQAVDATVQFTLQGNANVACGAAGCVVTANVTNQVLGTGQTKVTGAQVSATMTASVVLNGQPAGSCVSPPTLVPADGSGTLTCTVVEAGAIYAEIVAQAQAAKQTSVTITATGSAEVTAQANVQAEVERQVRRVDAERNLTMRGPPGTLRTPRVGDTDGGPGRWITATPTGSPASQAYQERASGVTRGLEYLVGNRRFDGYENGILLDGKDRYSQFINKKTGDWQGWWTKVKPKTPNKPSGLQGILNEANTQVGQAGTTPIEWRVQNPQVAALIQTMFDNEGIPIRVRYFP